MAKKEVIDVKFIAKIRKKENEETSKSIANKRVRRYNRLLIKPKAATDCKSVAKIHRKCSVRVLCTTWKGTIKLLASAVFLKLFMNFKCRKNNRANALEALGSFDIFLGS